MLAWVARLSGAGLLHPIHPAHAELSSLVIGLIAAGLVAGTAVLWPGPATRSSAPEEAPLDPWSGRLSRAQAGTRALGILLVVLAVVAGRLGSPAELSNIAPALVVGFAWPALLFVSGAAGPVWRWVDPWDGIARAVGPKEADGNRVGDVRFVAITALAWAWYLAVYTDSTSPRSVGLALGVYAVVMLAGALALGRTTWLPRVDVFGNVFGWLALVPRGRLSRWRPPRGAELVLGTLAGGIAFGAVRTSEIWGELNVVPGARLYATLAMIGSAAVVAGALWALARWADRAGASGSVAVAALPASAGVALVFALARSRLFTSLQLLPSLASDPFGAGWDLFGTTGLPIQAPLEPVELAAIQLLVLLLGAAAGAIALARRVDRPARWPGIVALTLLVVVGVVAATSAPGL